MTRQQALESVKDMTPTFLTRAKKNDKQHNPTWVCPKCGNGGGKSGTGITRDYNHGDGKHYKCFVCGLYEDVAGLWQTATNESDTAKALSELYNYYGLNIDNEPSRNNGKFTSTGKRGAKKMSETKPKQAAKPEEPKQPEPTAEELKRRQDFLEYAKHASETDYFTKRGLSPATIEKYMLGYCPDLIQSGYHNGPAAIIPKTKYTYTARLINYDTKQDGKYRQFGPKMLYLPNNLYTASKPIFIVEGELDTLSIIEAGGECMGLGSTSEVNLLISTCKAKKPTQPLIIALDSDEAGEKATAELKAGLENLQISFYRRNPCGDFKDPNEALVNDRAGLEKRISEIYAEIKQAEESRKAEEIKAAEEQAKAEAEKKEKERKEYITTESAAGHIEDFLNNIANVNTSFIPTGFAKLDKALGGGLYEGLHIMGAVSSLGKTTFILQAADQIAAQEHDVLIFSLEMARAQLMAKSISRETFLNQTAETGGQRYAKTARDITTRARWEYYNDTDKQAIKEAIDCYASYSEHIFIHEGVGNLGVKEIKERTKKHIELTGNKPVVIIDYLQILAPNDPRATDKANTDIAVLELKRLSRDLKIPVIAISSLNRDSYSGEISERAFKESGAIEYGSDVLFGLQFKGCQDTGFDMRQAKARYPRDVELVILKQREGETGTIINYQFYTKFNFFDEM